MDDSIKFNQSKFIIWGAGYYGEIIAKEIMDRYSTSKIVAIVDSYIKGISFLTGLDIIEPRMIKDIEFDYVIIASDRDDTTNKICNVLYEFGIQESKIISFNTLNELWNDYFYYDYVRFFERNVRPKKNRIFMFMVPEHGNTGDYAIAVSTIDLLNKYFPCYEIITVTKNEWSHYSSKIGSLVGSTDVIMLNGGGYIGDLWDNTETYRSIIEAFPNNQIIMMPNTLTYKQYPASLNKSFKDDMEWFSARDNVRVFFRDEESYHAASKYGDAFSLHPDMALNMSFPNNKEINSKKCLLCLRDDREKTVDLRNDVFDILTSDGYTVDFFDIHMKRFVDFKNANKLVQHVCEKIQEYDFVITDRLHGMILAVVSNVPCIAFDNYTHKVSGVYKWIEKYAVFCSESDVKNIDIIVKNAIKKKKQAGVYDPSIIGFDGMIDDLKLYLGAINEKSTNSFTWR